MSVEYNKQQLPEMLLAYYRFLFPHKLFHKWLSYSNGKTFIQFLCFVIIDFY